MTTTKEKNVLVLQGGGALGAYQAGAYSALHDAGYEPEWLAGISIGAINSAIIAGTPPNQRVEKLHAFWDKVSSGKISHPLFPGEFWRTLFSECSALEVATFGAEGFFKPHLPSAYINPLYNPFGAQRELGYYDTSPLRNTLLELVDFERLNQSSLRMSIGAVNVTSGNFIYFDSSATTIIPEHIMASAALPEGFPPIEIDGEWYWDGSLVSNTPLQHVIDQEDQDDMLIFQVDLFPAEGTLPKNNREVGRRIKDIRHSSRTRLNTNTFKQSQQIRKLIEKLVKQLPESAITEEELSLLNKYSCDAAVTLVHLIYRQQNYELASKDYEFSRTSVKQHWQAGVDDVEFMLKQPSWRNRKPPKNGLAVFDFNQLHSDT